MKKNTPTPFDKIAQAIVPDPSQIPDIQVLNGFLGKSDKKDHVRLYLSLEFNSFIELKEDDVVYVVSLESELNSLGGTILWARRGANIISTNTSSREAQVDFLKGRIASGHVSRRRRLPLYDFRLSHLYQPIYSAHVSCVREFCEFVATSWDAGGSVYCGGHMDPTWEAECP